MRNKNVKYTAICGVFAGVAVTIMCIGGLIPIATYVTPMLCVVIAQMILVGCGRRFAMTWYVAVSILSLILGPDKEAGMLFCFLGNYPCLKRVFERNKLSLLWKILYFNIMIFALYWVIANILGMKDILDEYHTLGTIGLCVFVLLGNITFLILDRILSFKFVREQK